MVIFPYRRQRIFLGQTGASSPDPEEAQHTASMSVWHAHCEEANPRHHPPAEPFQPAEPGGIPFSWTYEQESTEDISIRKSLDSFYETCCQQQPSRGDPTYNAASEWLSLKIQDLANKEGGKYSLCSLYMAQMVLNRDGCKVFPNHSSKACFPGPANGEVALEEGKRTPGLSDDVLQFLLKQNVMKS
ncbi:shieldin complex subunit 1 isoform X3 [Gopherus flavomarginatus]|uniref:shieldin complex subunit 1 isoform X3 n=1 Tax=Gopherus flavomarginatus TaxID=286002 RepID=UPI0021CC20AF|nr:shieldin complex subunit 1 isoform X3 [Gopherus flavomarginatus]